MGNLVFAQATPKDNQITIEGVVIDVKSIPVSKESSKQPPLLIIVKATKLTDREGEYKINNELWILKISEEKKEAFKKYKPVDPITAYGNREGEARILNVVDEELTESKPK